MKLPSIPYLATAFLGVVRRFPLVMAAAAIGVVAIMLLIEQDGSANDKDFIKMALTCSLGLSVLLCASLVSEKWQLKQPQALVPHLVAVGLVVLYYFSLRGEGFDTDLAPIRFIGLNLAAHLGVAFLPYLDQSPVEDFWEYNKRLFGNFMVGGFLQFYNFCRIERCHLGRERAVQFGH